jgi:hypothetical protein
MRLGQFVTLDHRPHRAIQNQDALLQEFFYAMCRAVHSIWRGNRSGFYHVKASAISLDISPFQNCLILRILGICRQRLKSGVDKIPVSKLNSNHVVKVI